MESSYISKISSLKSRYCVNLKKLFHDIFSFLKKPSLFISIKLFLSGIKNLRVLIYDTKYKFTDNGLNPLEQSK